MTSLCHFEPSLRYNITHTLTIFLLTLPQINKLKQEPSQLNFRIIFVIFADPIILSGMKNKQSFIKDS